jgi:hypothetical protein
MLMLPLAMLGALLGFYLLFSVVSMMNLSTWSWQVARRDAWFARCVLMVLGTMGVGIARVTLLHPRFNQKYAGWLTATPWQPELPLPLGPVNLVWEDLLLLIPLALLAWFDIPISPLLPVTFYLVGFSAAVVSSIRGEQAKPFIASWVLLWSLALLSVRSPWLLSMVLVGSVFFTRFANEMSLGHFPWDIGDPMREIHRQPRASLSWPFDRVGPIRDPKPITPAIGWATAALAGWWIFVIMEVIDRAGGRVLLPAFADQIPAFLAVLTLFQLAPYVAGNWPPISLRGRLMTGRLIIPGYDYVLIRPALACGLAWGLPRLLHHLPLQVSTAITVFGVVGVALNLGPSLQHWRLTGQHRMVPLARREPIVPKPRNTRAIV